MPSEQVLLEGRQIGRSGLSDAFKGKSLCSLSDVMEGSHNRKGGLTMIVNGDSFTVGKVKIGTVPFEGIAPGLVLTEENLRTEESDFKVREEIPVAFNDRNTTGVVQDFVAKTTLLVGNELPGDPIHGKRNWEGNK
jgi:hypothetical protein